MNKPILFIGNKNYSSWSLRAWLACRWGLFNFEERSISLDAESSITNSQLKNLSPSHKVPFLKVEELIIYDSLSIAEFVAETNDHLWPQNALHRACARSFVCEIHSSFSNLRKELPMNLKRIVQQPIPLTSQALEEIEKFFLLFEFVRQKYSTEDSFYLFGQRSLADCFALPIFTRFKTYKIPIPTYLQYYSNHILVDMDFLEWQENALQEKNAIAKTDNIYPSS